jgi:hypothetical protein
VEYDYDLTYPAILVVIAVEGSGEWVIDGMAAGRTASWSPDLGSVVVGGFAVRRADLDSGAVVELVPQPSGTEGSPDFAPEWRPTADDS